LPGTQVYYRQKRLPAADDQGFGSRFILRLAPTILVAGLRVQFIDRFDTLKKLLADFKEDSSFVPKGCPTAARKPKRTDAANVGSR
jgi:hypothetical protein